MSQLELFERWLPVHGYEGLYEVSDFGRVHSLGRIVPNRARPVVGRILLGHNRSGYHRVRLCKGGKWRFVSVHSLVMRAFVGVSPPGSEIDHRDGNTLNNALWNLAYVTPSENSRRAVKRRGAWPRKKRVKFDVQQVAEVRRLALEGMSQVAIAEHFGSSRRTIGHILSGRNWKNA